MVSSTLRTAVKAVDRWFRRSPAGRILAFGLVLLVLLIWVFAETTDAVIDQDDITVVDSPATQWLVQRRVPWMTAAFQVITELASGWFVVMLIVVLSVVLWRYRRPWSELLVVPISCAGTALLVLFTKLAIARPRPTIGEIIETAAGFSFPSGHSAQAVACYGALAWLVAHLTVTRRSTVLAWAAATVLAVLIGVSRLYLGVHWLSDVVGGWVLGAAWLTVTLSAVAAAQRWSDATTETTADAQASAD